MNEPLKTIENNWEASWGLPEGISWTVAENASKWPSGSPSRTIFATDSTCNWKHVQLKCQTRKARSCDTLLFLHRSISTALMRPGNCQKNAKHRVAHLAAASQKRAATLGRCPPCSLESQLPENTREFESNIKKKLFLSQKEMKSWALCLRRQLVRVNVRARLSPRTRRIQQRTCISFCGRASSVESGNRSRSSE